MTEKEKMLSKCFMTRMMLKSYQMIWARAKDLCYDYSQLRPSKELFAL